MLYQVISHTPIWVFGLLAVLLAVGLKQSRSSSMGLLRASLLPAALVALSIYDTLSAFGATPAALLAWLLTACAVFTLVLRSPLPEEVTYDPANRTLQLPGSWVPLALMSGIFVTKYFVGVVLALQPSLAGNPAFAIGFAAVYGAFSGVFAGRATRLLRLALRSAPSQHAGIA